MVFSSLFFVFMFLVSCYMLYSIMPGIRLKNIVLLLFSLVFYAWGGPLLLLLLAGMTFICYIGGRLIARFTSHRRFFLICTLILCLGLLATFKYTGFFLSNVQAIFGVPREIPQITLPIGISFYTFQLLSYVIDVYRGEVPAQKKFWILLLYAALFHQCIAGPIIRYQHVNDELENRKLTREDLSKGVSRFASGLAKKALFANGCAQIVHDLIEKPSDLTSVSSAAILLAAFAYMLEIYLDFSAYSDMAIGLGLMCGFHYRENFNYPYIAHSVTDFWRRWHISLSSFFRDYVYIPLGGNRVGAARQILNLLIVWFLTGLWHGASWNFVLWGLYYFVFLLLEKFLLRLKKTPSKLARIPRTAYTLIVVFFGWMIFYYTDTYSLVTAVKGVFLQNGNSFIDMAAKSQFFNNVFFLAVSVLACLPILPFISSFFEKIRAKGRKEHRAFVMAYDAFCALAPSFLLLLSVFALVGDTYNPFLYFQF